MPNKRVTVDYDEIFTYAEEKYDLDWNTCCDIFYKGHELLQSPETYNKSVYLGDLEGDLSYIQDKSKKYYNKNKEKAAEVIISFMKKNGLEEMLVLND